ncbi:MULTISPECIES: VOC family protein [Thermocrispum]|jgi:catechol 2,3-dioxygenase-like lactoylglutathione lyase family enzyme|uniref:Glyoxalase/bleomycin resistance/dioxygenase family protein n=1 Tax=Thermocrispum agreste TaxID=37925 RepID=A0A2W4LSN7_9PSEU|nr:MULTISPECIES: VOC family protein [Thermocrispum]PZN00684.1 MAG: glyoxalase/bleomycin resistance/dioxygenase family protein [Thermocrispum agreste]
MEVLSSRIVLRPSDPERTHAFYGETLGLAVYRQFPGGKVYFLGNGLLEVSGRGEEGERRGLALWLQVRDLSDALAELALAGVPIVRGPRREPWGLHEAWIADPDGVRIVLVEVPEGHPLRSDPR